ncbi:MAG: hypothetical protein EOP84_29555, partial [Verrucomicrobiaceae bacterium]
MHRAAGTMLVAIAGAVLVFLALKAGKIEANRERPEIQFRRSTSWDHDAVGECVKAGNGSHIFREYEWIGNAAPYGPPEPPDASTYIDGRGSSIIIERLNGRTEVRLKSARPLSDEQKDLLEWCVTNPQLTWIARR